MQFYDRYIELCKEIGKRPSKVAEEIGISRATVTNWKKNNYTPRADMLAKIANYFNLSVSDLLGTKKEPTEVDPLNEELLKLFKDLSPESKAKMVDYAQLLSISEQNK